MIKFLAGNWVSMLLAAGIFSAGFLVSDWRDQGTIERLRLETSELKRAVTGKALAQVTAAAKDIVRTVTAENTIVARLRARAVEAEAQAEADRRRLHHALAQSAVHGLECPGSWGVLFDTYARLARKHAEAAAHAGGIDGGSGSAASAAVGEPRAQPVSCDLAFEYARILLHDWDRLADRLRALQAAIRTREAIAAEAGEG